jgi:hypothetical protein
LELGKQTVGEAEKYHEARTNGEVKRTMRHVLDHRFAVTSLSELPTGRSGSTHLQGARMTVMQGDPSRSQQFTVPRTVKVEARGAVRAPADRVYNLIADYNTGHPRIVPPKYFQNFNVERGGVGAGTVVTFEMKVLGRISKPRAQITEPQPGRVLVETIEDQGIVTTFRVEPTGASSSQVTISTVMPTRRGIAGSLEGAFIRSFLSRVYRDELAQIDRVATS